MGLQFIPMEFDESSEFKMELDRLESESRKIRVLNVVERQGRKRYLVAVPDDQVDYLAAKLTTYRDDVPTEERRPRNEPLASGISSIADGDLEDYWSDEGEDLPEPKEEFWWEVWLGDLGDSEVDVEQTFRDEASTQGIRLSEQTARFPERVVILAYTSFEKWQEFPGLLRDLTEFRRANMLTGEFRELAPSDQGEFVARLAERAIPAGAHAPAVCLLDTGVNRGHPLLERSLSENETQAWKDEWGAEDHEGHGTELAGLALYGALERALLESDELPLTHRLESVKILPPVGKNEPPDYGPITVGSMAKAELQSPQRSRVFCLATTSESDDHWRPTLWSASVDAACSGVDAQPRRLVVAAAGNLREHKGVDYPQENYMSSIEDPSQAWNVLSVGAYTNFSWPGEPDLKGYECIALPGTLSPASRTSYCWGRDSPWLGW